MMDQKKVIVKTITKEVKDKVEAGIVWYKMISIINDFKLAKREIELLSFINYRGTISSSSSKEEFCRLFDSSPGTISNMISKKLVPLALLVKEKGKIKINPLLKVDFNNNLVVRFFLNVNEIKEEDVNK